MWRTVRSIRHGSWRLRNGVPRLSGPGDELIIDFGPAGSGVCSMARSLLPYGQSQTHRAAQMDGGGSPSRRRFRSVGSLGRVNNSYWYQLHPGSSDHMMLADFIDEERPRSSSTSWGASGDGTTRLAGPGPSDELQRMAAANIDGIDGAELIVDFPGNGLWALYNLAEWRQIHPLNSSAIVTGDFDGDARDDLIVSFPGQGVWNYANNTTWSQVHWMTPTKLAVGNLDDSGVDDLVMDFPGYGLWP